MRTSLRFAALILSVSSPLLHAADGTLVIVSEVGDFVGQGKILQLPFTGTDVSLGTFAGALHLNNSSARWDLLLAGLPSHHLDVGCYERALRAPTQPAGRPGLDFTYASSACNAVVGRYKVLEMVNDAQTGLPTTLAVDFVQHCEGAGPALFGKLRYNSTLPADISPLDPVFTTSGTWAYTSETGDFIGGGKPGNYNLDRLKFLAKPNSYNGLSMNYFDHATNAFWNMDMAAADKAILTVGTYLNPARYPFQTVGVPGFDYNAACSTMTGSFAIGQISHERIDGLPQTLSSTMLLHCNGNAPAFSGNIVYNTQYRDGAAVDDIIFSDNLEGTARTWPLFWDCP
jgi:hypothetical protein